MLKFLKPFSLEWWQAGLYELAMLSFGIFIGKSWPHLFYNQSAALLVVFAVFGGYIIYVWLCQQRADKR